MKEIEYESLTPFFIKVRRVDASQVILDGAFTADMRNRFETPSGAWERYRYHLQNLAGVEDDILKKADSDLAAKMRADIGELYLLPSQIQQLGFNLQ